jgi:hypothetical protein
VPFGLDRCDTCLCVGNILFAISDARRGSSLFVLRFINSTMWRRVSTSFFNSASAIVFAAFLLSIQRSSCAGVAGETTVMAISL